MKNVTEKNGLAEEESWSLGAKELWQEETLRFARVCWRKRNR
jgi:hypothetical protein